jgi:hypothetical protein
MLDDQAVDPLASESPDARGALPLPDPTVADSARLRLATLRARYAARPAGQPASPLAEAIPARVVDDIQAIGAVLAASRSTAIGPADALDVGAALVVLCDLRAELDRLEGDLLGAAQVVGLSWDVVAAIMGIPADEAQRRYQGLRERQVSP